MREDDDECTLDHAAPSRPRKIRKLETLSEKKGTPLLIRKKCQRESYESARG